MEKAIENEYPRPMSVLSLLDVTPRPACFHDPAGLLETCDICNFSCINGRLGIVETPRN